MPQSSSSPHRKGEWLYGLANLGGVTGYMPLLVLLLPRRVEAWSPDGAAGIVSALLLAGSVTASLSNIAAGHWSDRWFARTGNRRALVAAGAVLLAACYAGMGLAHEVIALAVLVVVLEIVLNLLLAPLGALLADYVPDQRKGAVAGMLNAAMPLSYGVIALVTLVHPADSDAAFVTVAALVLAMVLPLVLFWPFPADPRHVANMQAFAPPPPSPGGRRDLTLAWLARLLMQFGGALSVGYLFLYVIALQGQLGTPPGGGASALVGQLSLVALAGSFAMTVVGGKLSDLLGRRRWPLSVLALIAAAGLVAMAMAPGWTMLALGYGLFNIGLAGYLAIDAALVAQLLSGHPRRGALLGVMNLTNTLPTVLVPALALLAIADGSIAGLLPRLLIGAAITALAAAMLVSRIRSIR